MEVEIISRETIRPSSPTPPHIRTFKLSLLDQLRHVFYAPLMFFYPMPDCKISQVSTQLKDSLSKTLSLFYPLAGRIKDHVSIDCNDKGVLFSEARVDCHMSNFLQKPKLDLLQLFLPYQEIFPEPVDYGVQVAIQLNVFSSGGIVLGILVSHKLIDAITISSFLKTWASFASGCYDKAVYPDYTSALLFPPRESLKNHKSLFVESWLRKEKKGVLNRFVFDSNAISSLRGKAGSEHLPNPTRVEVVSAFIWKQAMAASKKVFGAQKSSILAHTVNLRRKMVPPLSDYSIGNIIWTALAHHKAKDPKKDTDLHVLVGLVRESISKVYNEYAPKLQGDDGLVRTLKFFEEVDEIYSKEKPDIYAFSSWCNLGVNEVDFGWGKPIWVCFPGGADVNPVFMNLVILSETTWGHGIEALVILGENEMAILEQDLEFLNIATINPSISIPVARL